MKKGFTLVELLVVATIIAMLATIGITSYGSISKQSRDSRRKADMENTRAAIEFYRSANDAYPDTLEDLLPDYMNAVLTDPKTQTEYQYCPNAARSDYMLCGTMEGTSSTNGSTCSTCGTCNGGGCNYKLTPLGED